MQSAFTKMPVAKEDADYVSFGTGKDITSLSRGSNFTGSLNIDFLSGCISAWNDDTKGFYQPVYQFEL